MSYSRLTIDRGNTALKAATWSHDAQPDKVVSLPACASVGEALAELCPGGVPVFDAVAYSSVVKNCREEDLRLLSTLGCLVYDVKSPDVRIPFINGYSTPQTLGADRVAALAGAVGLAGGGPALVADMGTAATFDLLTSTPDGPMYVGGNISPGVPMRLHSLHEHTSALPEVSPELVPDALWGTSTTEALLGGAVYGMLAELEYYRSHAPAEAEMVLTGGGADYLVRNNLITFKHIHDPHLVLRGLNSIITYNENR